MVFTSYTRRRAVACRVINSQLDGSTAAVEGHDDHVVVAISPYKTGRDVSKENTRFGKQWLFAGMVPAGSLSDLGAPSRGRPPSSRLPRSLRAHSTDYVSVTIAARCRCGWAAAGEPKSDRLLTPSLPHNGASASQFGAEVLSRKGRIMSCWPAGEVLRVDSCRAQSRHTLSL